MTVPAAYVAIGHGRSTLPLFPTSTYNPGPALALSGPAQGSSAGPPGKVVFSFGFTRYFHYSAGVLGGSRSHPPEIAGTPPCCRYSFER